VLSLSILKRPFVWRYAMSNVCAAMDMAGRASLLWRGIRRFEIV
jgi:hypothetical protein